MCFYEILVGASLDRIVFQIMRQTFQQYVEFALIQFSIKNVPVSDY